MGFKQVSNAGFVRMADLMFKMMTAAEDGDKEALMRFSETFGDDASDFVGMLFQEAGVTNEDFAKFAASNELEQAAQNCAGASDVRQGMTGYPSPS